MVNTNNFQESDSLFKQILLNPDKNELFYVLDACYNIVSEKDTVALYKKILSETLKSLHAKKGALYLNVNKEEQLEMINHLGISEKELHHWGAVSQSVKDELKISNKAFYEISDDRKVDLNSAIIPIYYKDALYAFIKVTQREELGKFTKQDLNIANQISSFINIAIENTKTAPKTGKDALKIRDKRAFKASYFYDFFSNETKRAKRYKKTFSIIYFKIENFDAIKSKFREETVKNFINGILDKLNIVIRETDFIAEEAESKYLIMLPETDYFGSLMTMRKIDYNLANSLVIKENDNSLPVTFRMSSASFLKDGETEREILKALTSRLENAKNSIIEKVNIKQASFWNILKSMVGNEKDYPVYTTGTRKIYIKTRLSNIQDDRGITRYAVFHPLTIRQIENVIFKESAINPTRRGIIYIGNSPLDYTFSILKELPDFEYSKSRLFLLTKQCNKEISYHNVTYIFTADVTITDYYFVIYLNEEYGYGIFAKKNLEGAYYGFHTSDAIFIENLIAKLQNQYLLQEQL